MPTYFFEIRLNKSNFSFKLDVHMKRILLFSTLRIISLTSFGQKQISNFEEIFTKDGDIQPIGRIDDYFYVIMPDYAISRIHIPTREMSTFIELPDAAFGNYDALIANEHLFFLE